MRCLVALIIAIVPLAVFAQNPDEQLFPTRSTSTCRTSRTDKSVKYDYDIVYVRADAGGRQGAQAVLHRLLAAGDDGAGRRPDAAASRRQRGTAGRRAARARSPIRSSRSTASGSTTSHIYDLRNANQWYAAAARGRHLQDPPARRGKIVRLTNQQFTPNTGAADWSSDYRTPEKGKTHFDYGVFNMGPCPLPGGKLVVHQQPRRLPCRRRAIRRSRCNSS